MMEKRSNRLLILMAGIVVIIMLLATVLHHGASQSERKEYPISKSPRDEASGDTEAETLKALAATVRKTEQAYQAMAAGNEALQAKVSQLEAEQQVPSKEAQQDKMVQHSTEAATSQAEPVTEEPLQLEASGNAITTVSDLTPYHPIVKTHHDTTTAIKAKSNHAVYTIAPNSTAVDATLMTSMIGRVPVNGKIDDPYPFKLIIGKQNLIANDIYLPALHGMMASGYAVGEMNAIGTFGHQCARGYITSVTFVFNDGHIVTKSSNQNQKADADDDADALAWVSDIYGNPCVDGAFYTNAPKYLALDMGLNAAAGAANAYSNSQTTTLASGDSLISGITGNNGKYVLGQALSGSTKDTNDWLRNRLSQSFDAVVVRPVLSNGQYRHLSVHFQQSINIDLTPDGRRVHYGTNNQARFIAHTLD